MAKEPVKIITGIRRCGKSAFLRLIQEELRRQGVEETRIVSIDFESMAYAGIRDAASLHRYVLSLRAPQGKTYLFIDEIQEVVDWERAIASFLVDFDADIYVTGSSSSLLSSELSTRLTGRYVQIPMLTLSFQEAERFRTHYSSDSTGSVDEALLAYIRTGGFPAVYTGNYAPDDAMPFLKDIYSSVLLRDVIQRHGIRNIDLLEKVVRYAFDNIGLVFSAHRVSSFFKSENRKVDPETVYNFLNYLAGAFVLYRVPRFDLKGKSLLQVNEKHYLGDIGLRHALLGYRPQDISGLLENIVFLELVRRGYSVSVGKVGDQEIDFVAETGSDRIYVQVAYLLSSPTTVEREFNSLRAVQDHFPKYVVSMDPIEMAPKDGIQHVRLSRFLTQEWRQGI